MAEVKDYIAKADDVGSVSISEEVIASIAALAAAEIDGVAALGSANVDIADFLGKKSAAKGVKILLTQDTAEISVALSVKRGVVIPTVAKAVQEKVAAAVESMTGLKVTAVNVKVAGIVFEKEAKHKKPAEKPEKKD